MPALFLIRGLPGAGKTTFAKRLLNTMVIEADHFRYNAEGNYDPDPSRNAAAHTAACEAVASAIFRGHHVAVANTFSCRWEMDRYLQWARRAADSSDQLLTVVVIDLFDCGFTDEELAWRCTHGMPMEKILAMRVRWES